MSVHRVDGLWLLSLLRSWVYPTDQYTGVNPEVLPREGVESSEGATEVVGRARTVLHAGGIRVDYPGKALCDARQWCERVLCADDPLSCRVVVYGR